MDLALSFIVAVAAGVVCHYIIKWLDSDKQPVTSLWIQTFPHKNQEQKNPRMALRGFFVAVHYGIALSFCLLALQHMQFNNTICNFNRKWVCPCFSCLFMLYYHPLQNPKKPRSYKGFADFRRKVIYLLYMPSAAFVKCPCKHGRLTHCCAKMNRVFVTFHT